MLLVVTGRPTATEMRAALLEQGFVCTEDRPRMFGLTTTTYTRGEDRVRRVAYTPFATCLIEISGNSCESLAESLGHDWDLLSEERVMSAPWATERPAVVRHLFVLGTFATLRPELTPALVGAFGRALGDDDPLTRWVALRCLPISAAAAEVLAIAADHHTELLAPLARMRRTLGIEAIESDRPTQDPVALLQRAREAVEQGHGERAVAAATALLERSPGSIEAAYLAGLGHALERRPLPALLFLGASLAAIEHDRRLAELEGRTWTSWTGLDGAPSRIEPLRSLAAQASDDERMLVANLAETWLVRWSYAWRPLNRVGAARALRGLVEDLDPLLYLTEGKETRQLPALEAAARLCPSSTIIAFHLATTRLTIDPVAGRAALESLLERVRSGGAGVSPPDPAAERVARVEAAGISSVTVDELSVLAALGDHASATADLVRAIAIAEEIIRVDPGRADGWRRRAEASIAQGPPEAALAACRDEADALDRIHARDVTSGGEIRARAWLRVASLAAGLGHHAEAVRDLRLAIALRAQLAEEAREDPRLAALVDEIEASLVVAPPRRLLWAPDGDEDE